ncbi:MAG TPA: glycosyltransferase [Rhizomicrobium sp.]|nr:glycosyltransferase [Rhizomicrobium sp.]
MSDVLVYDRPGAGHERRAVEVISRVLDAQSLIEPLDTALPKLKAWPGPVFLCTANGYVSVFNRICINRLLAGRRTIGQFIRDPRVYRENLRSAFRSGSLSLNRSRLLMEAVLRLPLVHPISTLPPAPDWPLRFRHWLYDPEWWDLSVAPLVDVDVPLQAGGQTVLYLGKVQHRKGTSFFLRAAQDAARRKAGLQFVIVGDASELTDAQRTAFAAAGGLVIPRAEDDATFVSFIRRANWVWCCYEPAWEASSGIFGRALQLGTKSIVRKASYLAHFHSVYAKGIEVVYDDVDDLLEGLGSPDRWQNGSVDIADLGAFSIRCLRASCGLR